MTKRRWIVLAAALGLVVFCLWYTRPRNFTDLIGGEPIVSIAGSVSLSSVENGKPKSESWSMSKETESEEILAGLADLIESCQYRVRLRNLLPFWRRAVRETEVGSPSALLAAAVGDGGAGTVFFLCQEGNAELQVISPEGECREILTAPVDKELAEKLYAYMMEYGSTP